ncbi:CD276 antigen homolog [Seriola aureovittata]|uniref:CD276 antigen homolog n=1 Tax=Seriola aureovittata TaxID=2871759 RepID=UPI0024BD9281|nr:CD276 antigen homolog [Seriola aureovittata]
MVGVMTYVLSALSLVFHLFLLLPLSSANIIKNGTIGFSWLWQCQCTFSKPFQPEESLIYWQSKALIVAHVYAKGKEEFKYQHQLFKNRTKIFPDQLSSGNFSLVIESLMLKDDKTAFEVIFINSTSDQPEKLCQVTLHVSAPFHEPKIEINQDEKIATCSTKGGYPKPEVTWRSGDLLEGHERTLELHETTITNETDDTYSIRSTVNITGLLKVTCTVYNPTSHQTLSATTDMTPSPPTPVFAVVCFSLSVAAALIILYCINRRCNQTNGKVSENSPPSPEDPTDSNMSGGNVHEGSVSQTGTRAVIFRSTRKSDGSVDSETNNLSTADTDAEQEKQEQSVSVKILDETNTPESDKDK